MTWKLVSFSRNKISSLFFMFYTYIWSVSVSWIFIWSRYHAEPSYRSKSKYLSEEFQLKIRTNFYSISLITILYFTDRWEYILFRNVKHCGTGSAPRISSHQFHQFPESVPIPFHTEILRIPLSRNSRNSVTKSVPTLTCMHCVVAKG